VTEEHLKSLASYQILGQVATGSAAIVYKAHDPEQGRFLALKRLIAPSAEQRALGYEEVRTLAKVSDPHVVSVYEFFEEGEDAYVAEEWIDGATVARLIADGAPFSPIQAVAVMRDALSGLARAHRSGIVHGDVSPTNVMVDFDGVSKLVDFGSAGASGGRTPSTRGNYASPEALAGRTISAASDVYSAATLLAQLVQGHPPADRGDLAGIWVPFRMVLSRSMSSDPKRRPADAAALLALLEEHSERHFGPAYSADADVAGLVRATGAAAVIAFGPAANAIPWPDAEEPAPAGVVTEDGVDAGDSAPGVAQGPRLRLFLALAIAVVLIVVTLGLRSRRRRSVGGADVFS
jgi:serine/threonine protein kinase